MTGLFPRPAGALAVLAFVVGAHPACAEPLRTAVHAPRARRPAEEPTTTYTVRQGDTLWDLGEKYFLRRPSYEEVRVRNGVRFVRRLQVGRELVIPTRLLRTELVNAVLGAFRGAVTVTGPGVAGAPRVGMVLQQGAEIGTGANAFARLDLPDGSRVSIPSQSRVRLDMLRRVLLTGAVERRLFVEAGRTQSTVVPLTRPQDVYEVKTPVSVSAVRGTEFRVAYDQSRQAASTGVVEGKVAVDGASSGTALVPARFGVGVSPGQPLAVVSLLPAPAVADPGRIQDGPRASFEVEPVEGARAYRIQLAEDAGMQDIFAEQAGADRRFEFQGVEDGDHFLRVTGIDEAGIEGLPQVYAFRRELNAIAPGGVTTGGSRGDRRFLFKWQAEGEGVRTYRFQLSKEASAEPPVIDEGGLRDTQLTVTNLRPGAYAWRVMSATSRKDALIEKWSAPQTFTVPAN